MRRVPYFLIALVLALALVSTPGTSEAKPKKNKKQEAAAAEKPEKRFKEWKKVLKDAKTQPGLFTLHRVPNGNLYVELRQDQLDKPVLAIWSIARGIGRDFAFGGLSYGFHDRLLEFHRMGDEIQVIEKNTKFVGPEGTAIARAIDLSFGNSVIASLKIESEHDSSKAVLVDFTPFLVSDISDFTGFYTNFNDSKPLRFDKDRSALTTAKAFPENIEIEALLTYTPTDRRTMNINTVPDDRYVPITMHYSFSKLPDNPMTPRMADDRTGYFLNAVKDFSLDTQETYWRRFITRWRLEKKDPTAAVSEPVKPIVFYVDHTIPEKFRPYIREGIEAWQSAFEAAGFKNAILAKDPPADDPDYDPADVRYSTIRWITSSDPAFGAIGPSRVDPRTGEILDADILFDAIIVQTRWSVYNNLVGPSGIYEMPWMRNLDSPIPLAMRCDAGLQAPVDLAMVQLASVLDGTADPGNPAQEKFVGEMLVQVTLHEVGHSLGLTHNFRSSTDTPADKLHDVAWTKSHGLTSSVMDYAAPNIARERAKQGQYYTSVPGTADLWMIRYGYTPSGATDTEADYAFIKHVADESNMPGHAYSPDADTYGPNALDPRSNIRDMGDDPLQFGKELAAWVADILKSDTLEARILGDDGEYPKLRRAVDGLLGQYARGLSFGVKYIGGQYQSRNHRGQPGVVEPMQPVPAARQREALAFLSERAFAADAFKMSPGLVNRLAPDRWLHWGVRDGITTYTGSRLDYDLGDKVVAIQKGILNALTAPMLLARLREAESHSSDPYRLSTYFNDLTAALWGEVGSATPTAIRSLDGPHTRRELQRAYVDELAEMVVAPAPGLPDDARALARLQLDRIDGRAAKALRGEVPLGDNVRAHLLETRARIKRAEEAASNIAMGRRGGGGPGGNGAAGE